jgi:imidazolonepropionase-like amidohydrolase
LATQSLASPPELHMRTRHGRQSWSSIRSVAVLAALSWTPVQAGTPTPFAPPPSADLVLYRDATLIDGTGAPARPHMDVLVAGERILGVFPDATSPAEATNARVVNLHGQYLMPGLIDSHVHLATPPNRRQAEAMLRRDLYGGVTAVRDMADDLRVLADITRASRVGEIAGPDVYYAALMAGPDFFNDPRTAQTSAGGVPGQVPWMQAVTDQTDIPLAVARAAGTSATAIKLYADLNPTLAGRITAEAHRQHLLVWSHATLYPAKPSEVVAAGVDAISHACLLVREPDPDVPRWSQPRHPVDLGPLRAGDNPTLARLFAVMAKRGVILDATVWTYGAPPSVGPSSTPPLTPGGCDDIVGGAITGQAYRAGVQISTGTDNVAPWTDPWPDLFHELLELRDRADMPPAAVLRSATLVGARAAGQEREMGSLEPGKLANMVVLAKNPLSSIDNLKTVVMTVKRGRAFLRDDFRPLREDDITDF